ncbi:MAG: LolA family protein [Rhodospirillaceae bacterium]
MSKRMVGLVVAGVMAATALTGAALGVGTAPAQAQSLSPRNVLPTLSIEDRAQLAQIEQYMNTITSFRARFLQISSAGKYAEGTLSLRRPGHMRLEYDAPGEILMVANGRHLIYHDIELDQVSYVGLDETPLAVLLKERVSFADPDQTVTDVRRGGGVVEISLVQTDDPGQGTLTLAFTENPMSLRQWRVLDNQGTEVTVSLFNPKVGVTLEDSLFVFNNPSRGSRLD